MAVNTTLFETLLYCTEPSAQKIYTCTPLVWTGTWLVGLFLCTSAYRHAMSLTVSVLESRHFPRSLITINKYRERTWVIYDRPTVTLFTAVHVTRKSIQCTQQEACIDNCVNTCLIWQHLLQGLPTASHREIIESTQHHSSLPRSAPSKVGAILLMIACNGRWQFLSSLSSNLKILLYFAMLNK